MGNAFINGKKISYTEGMTILQAAREAGIWIPSLCDHPALESYGGCRLCIVEVKGYPKPVASCVMPLAEGMEITTESPELREIRRSVLELMLVRHPFVCLYCSANGRCDLQKLADHFGIKRDSFAWRGDEVPTPHPADESNHFFIREPDKCVLCGRCVRVCDSHAQYRAIDFENRGIFTAIQSPADFGMESSDCKSCGQCVAVCPTGALCERSNLNAGAAWTRKRVKTVCPYCGVGCSLVAEVSASDGKLVNVTSDHSDMASVNGGRSCVKGRFGWEFVNSEERLKTPLIKENGVFREASWDEALDVVAAGLSRNMGQTGFFASARCTNEDNYLMQRFAREVMRTNNVDHCAHL